MPSIVTSVSPVAVFYGFPGESERLPSQRKLMHRITYYLSDFEIILNFSIQCPSFHGSHFSSLESALAGSRRLGWPLPIRQTRPRTTSDEPKCGL